MFILALLFAVFIFYHFFLAPKKGAAIAAAKGYDHTKWYFYIWAFGIFAILYLFIKIDPLDQKEKRSLLLLLAGYVLIFMTAIWIDLHLK